MPQVSLRILHTLGDLRDAARDRPITLANDSATASVVAAAGRVLICAVFFISGFWKITAPKAMITYIASAGLPFPQLGLAIGIAVELVITPLFVLGYRTRCMAILLAAYCVATAIFFHTRFSDPNMLLHFFKNMAMAGGLLQITVSGGGRFSFDARRRRHLQSRRGEQSS